MPSGPLDLGSAIRVPNQWVCQNYPAKRVKGIEPSSVAWEATALPLSYARDSRGIAQTQADRAEEIFARAPEW